MAGKPSRYVTNHRGWLGLLILHRRCNEYQLSKNWETLVPHLWSCSVTYRAIKTQVVLCGLVMTSLSLLWFSFIEFHKMYFEYEPYVQDAW